MSGKTKLAIVEMRDGKPRLRWGPYFLGLAMMVVLLTLINGLLLAAGVWSGLDTVIIGLFTGAVVFNITVLYQLNRASNSGAPDHAAGSGVPPPGQPPRGWPPEPPSRPGHCPRCGAALAADTAEGLCPRCLMDLNVSAPTEVPTGEAGPGGTRPMKPPSAEALTLAEVARHFPQLEILDCLGRGGMGVVYKARQPHLNRVVALKILAPGREQDPAFAERFTREAQTLARLNHPSIVTLYDFGKTDRLYYLLMEHVEGVSLRQLLQGNKLAPEQALAIVPKICEALQYAHEHGVVHRDIKPENVLLDREGRVKIADFGIAKIVGGEGRQPGLTRDEQVIGTPHYMAPEQVEHPQRVDHRADIYSLGVVFYEMLTGELPLGKFAAPSKRVQVDVRLDEVVLRALEKEPERRYQHASEVQTDLESIRSTRAAAPVAKGPADETGELERARKARRLLRWPSTGLLGIGLCFPVAAACFLVFGQWPAGWQGALALFSVLVFGYVIIAGSWKMRRLEDYRLAVLAALLSLVVVLPGLPLAVFPIWALMVLSRPDVRAAFTEVARKEASSAAGPRPGAWVYAAGLVGVLAVGFALWAWNAGRSGSLWGVNRGGPARVVAVEKKLQWEIQQRLNEAGWKPESLSVSVAPNLRRAECRFGTVWKNGLTQVPFNAAIRLRPQGAGLWQVLGEGEFQSLRFSVDTTAEMRADEGASSSSTTPAVGLGPVREVTLNDLDDARGGEALDFDSGQLVDLPKDTDRRTEGEQSQWLKERSADVLLDHVGGRWGLLTTTDNELKLAPLPNGAWDTVAERQLSRVLAAEPSGLEIKQRRFWKVYVLPTNAAPPLTFALRTASGASGLLQITRFDKGPNCARLRYKLLRRTAP